MIFSTQEGTHRGGICFFLSDCSQVQQLPSREYDITKKELYARLDVCMGGRAAEEVVFGADNVTGGLPFSDTFPFRQALEDSLPSHLVEVFFSPCVSMQVLHPISNRPHESPRLWWQCLE